MKNTRFSTLLSLMLVGLSLLVFAGASIAADDREALQGITEVKAVFDVKKADPQKLLRALTAIRDAHTRLIQQGVKPDFVVTFRGPTVVCLIDMNEDPDVDEYKEDIMDKISWNIIELNKAGVQLEVCSLALKLSGMKNIDLLPSLKRIGNSLVSLMAYQNRGYALVAI